ncbi:zinc-ribbon domain-containing protein [Propionibacterium freudenreichii]|uniref:zinc ribbon domain-containing protein n=1 Tax=Propionibacterium freudenreichii TaxID=1744 RepID=UPI003A4C7E0C|nr:zinc-ribbon domain-containing protein [Propionibacterium freudenreichii]
MSEANGRVLVCPNCGSPVSDDDVTCPVCGVDLRGADLGGANLPRAGNDTAAAGASSPTPTSDTQSSGAPSSTTDSPDAEPTISVAASPDSTTPVGDKASGPATSSAVSAQDWRDYFQLLNGRAPTEAEFQRAVADGAARPLQAAPTFTESGPQGVDKPRQCRRSRRLCPSCR